ncbi:MAG: HDIG domain-containing protein [Deltaproteobacteria bacterium]|nr:HDIG domain-containing protein [Deltaproteobacteria bacterium]
MNPLQIIEKYYDRESPSYHYLVCHSEMVTEKAVEVAGRVEHLRPDVAFIREAAMLHDIGIFLTHAPSIGCDGDKPYLCHGYLGREIVEREGFPRHALVCERHIGVGITIEEIDENKLPIPRREIIPLTIEERIICYADKFFSKQEEFLLREKPIERIKKGLSRLGGEKVKRFEEMVAFFGP